MNKEEIKKFIEFRTDEDGTYFYYSDKDNVEQWSYELENLKDYIINLQQENQQLKKQKDDVVEYVKSKYFEENFPYGANELQVRNAILRMLGEIE